MEKPLVSILIPAHNEEKIIDKPLANLQKIREEEYRNLEVIVGLDGCTDKTEDIVREYKFVKIFKSKERSGKHNILKRLYKIARGKIIIIHDADWLLVTNNNFRNLIKYFENPKVGGVEDYATIKFGEKDSILVFGDSFIVKWLHDYKVKRQSQVINEKLYVKSNEFPFFVNMFRKSALKQNQITLCDDGERTIQIMKNGYLVAISQDDIPYFSIIHSSMSTGSFFRHKVRGHIARRQIQQKYKDYNASLFGFYLPAFIYTVTQALKVFFGVILYWLIAGLAFISSKTKKVSTKEGWKIRLKR